jgi:hypothetical protein
MGLFPFDVKNSSCLKGKEKTSSTYGNMKKYTMRKVNVLQVSANQMEGSKSNQRPSDE